MASKRTSITRTAACPCPLPQPTRMRRQAETSATLRSSLIRHPTAVDWILTIRPAMTSSCPVRHSPAGYAQVQGQRDGALHLAHVVGPYPRAGLDCLSGIGAVGSRPSSGYDFRQDQIFDAGRSFLGYDWSRYSAELFATNVFDKRNDIGLLRLRIPSLRSGEDRARPPAHSRVEGRRALLKSIS